MEAERKRIDWIDCARGIGILLVMVGHGVDGLLRALIFSFHMPLFFILSGRTFRPSKDGRAWQRNVKRGARQLLIPLAAVYLMRAAVTLWQSPGLLGEASYWKGFFCTFVFGSGVDIENSGIFGGARIEAMGMPWFFFALFFGRSLYDFLQMKCRGKGLAAACMAVSGAGFGLGKLQWLPFSLDIALAVIPFFYVGDSLRRVDLEKGTGRFLTVLGILWLATLAAEYPDPGRWTYLELAWRRYPLYPLCLFTAAAGSLFLCGVSIRILKLGKMVRPVLFLGKNSMYLLCVHCMDYLWHPLCYGNGPAFFSLMKKIMADVVIFLLVMAAVNSIKNFLPRRIIF